MERLNYGMKQLKFRFIPARFCFYIKLKNLVRFFAVLTRLLALLFILEVSTVESC